MKNKEDIPENIEFEDAEFESVIHSIPYSTLLIITIILGISLLASATLIFIYHRNVSKSGDIALNKKTPTEELETTVKIESNSNEENDTPIQENNSEAFLSTVDEATIELPAEVTIPRIETVAASSHSSSTKYGRYTPDQMFDGNKNTAWNAAWSTNKNTWVKIKLKEEAKVAEIGILPGYAKTNHPKYGSVFNLNHRLKNVEITFSTGRTITHIFLDEPSLQIIKIDPPESCTDLTIEVISVYPTERWSDVAISELSISGIHNK